MNDTMDTARVLVRPPLAWGLSILVGLALHGLAPLPFLPVGFPAGWFGTAVIVLAVALFAWAVVTMTKAGTNVPTNRPTTAIVASGPYRFTRNPIYLGMMLSLTGLGLALDDVWPLATLSAFALIIRYGVVPREKAYLERKFGAAYVGYRARVRRWL
jgi:protein-S-isoprenylcysteine O-methyltransferase Ste14